MGPLDFDSAAALIRRPVAGELAFEEAAVEYIWRQTAGRPLPIQAICHRLVSQRNRQGRREPIDAGDAQRAIDELAAERSEGADEAEMCIRDRFHSPDFVLPPVRGDVPTLLTVHDLSFVHYPATFPANLVAYLNRIVPRSVARATHILACLLYTSRCV